MALLRTLIAVVGLVLALAGLGAFTAAAIGIWQVKAEADRKTAMLAERAHTATDAADRAVDFVRQVLDKADQDLANARANAAPSKSKPVNPFVQLTAIKASRDLAGSVDRAHTAVITASDAVVVADAALQVFGEHPELNQWLGVHPEQVAQTRSELSTATKKLGEAKTVLGGIPLDPSDRPTAEQLRMVESALGQAHGLTDQMKQVVTTVRTRVDEAKRKADWWTLRIAIGTTILGTLGAAGQFFMARFFWRTLRRKPA